MRRAVLTVIFVIVCATIYSQRIVSLAPSITHTLKQLGAGDKIVGQTSYCPATNDQSAIVGDVLTINIEKIAALKPDIVFTMSFTQQQTIEKMRSLGIKVIDYPTPRNFDEICRQTVQIARHIKRMHYAVQLINKERNTIDSITQSMPAAGKKVMIQIGTRPLFAATPDTYIGEFIKRCRCTNIIAVGNAMASKEYVISAKPDVLIISTMGGAFTEDEELWKSTTEAKVRIIDENACCPTPTFYREALQQIANFITDDEE
ncbi:MAG: ABC transporter substrate-binding protein [Bacteroidales bacterium]|nr:ABC transporter substrate-binding protein [Bacteroidales bacterium]